MVVSMMILSVSGANAAKVETNTVSVGGMGSLIIKEDGTLWQQKYSKNQGDKKTTGQPTLEKVMDHTISVAAGATHYLAIRNDNSLWVWGDNNYGELGNGTNQSITTPTKIMDNVSSIAAGWYHSLAIKQDGSLWAWGLNKDNQLGDGTDENKNIPVKIMDDVLSVAAGSYYTLALKKDGTLWAWGENSAGQLGNGTMEYQITPVKIMDNASSVSVGFHTSFAIKKDGTLWGWGSNTYGELGIGSIGMLDDKNKYKTTPVKIMDNVTMVSGTSRTFAVKKDGTLWAWGLYWPYTKDINGKVTGSSVTVNASPTKIMNQVTAVSYGMNTLIIKDDGSLWDFGINDGTKLEKGTTQVKIVPVKIMDDIKLSEKKPGNPFINWLKELFK